MTLLLGTRPIIVTAELVRRVGMVEAAIVQQLQYWSERATCVHEGQSYVYKTYQDWSDEIGVSGKVARGALDRLRKDGVVVAIQNPADPRDRTLWWRIDHATLELGGPSDPEGRSSSPSGQSPSAVAGTSNAGASGSRSESTAEKTGKGSAGTREDAFPDDLPPSLHEVAIQAGKVLKRVAQQRGQRKAVTRAAVGQTIVSYPDRDHVQVAHDVEYWLLHGKGANKSCADIVARYRQFLKTSEPMAGPPMAVVAGPNVHPIRPRNGRTTAADYQALKGTLG